MHKYSTVTLGLCFAILALQLHHVLSVVQMAQAKLPNGQEVNIKIAISGRAQYQCLDCDEQVFAVKGSELEHHFRHAATGTSCRGVRGSQESVEHRMAKQKLRAILRNGGRLLIQNCKGVCRLDCHSVIRLLNGERVEVEYRLPFEQGVADLAIIPSFTDIPRVILEVYHSHKTVSRTGAWHELSAADIIAAKYTSDRTVTLIEQRALVSDRGCLASTFKDRVHLAGYHERTLTKADTFADELTDHWDNAVMNDDPKASAMFRTNAVSLKAKARWFLEDDYCTHGYFRFMNEGVDNWAKGYIQDYRAMQRAHAAIIKESRCIGCGRSFDNENWKLNCPKCWRTRQRQQLADDRNC